MNTIWLKLAGIALAVVVVLVVIGRFRSGESTPAPAPQSQSEQADKPKTIYDSFERDRKEFAVQTPQEDQTEPGPPPAQEAQKPAEEPVTQAPPQPVFEKLSIEQEVEAQRLHEMAVMERKQSRLPMMTPKRMVDYCREIIRRWPKSEYAFQAKRMLEDIPERYKQMYNITPQETDLSSFYTK